MNTEYIVVEKDNQFYIAGEDKSYYSDFRTVAIFYRYRDANMYCNFMNSEPETK